MANTYYIVRLKDSSIDDSKRELITIPLECYTFESAEKEVKNLCRNNPTCRYAIVHKEAEYWAETIVKDDLPRETYEPRD